MGGSVNTGGQNQNQTSVTTPWAPAAGQVQGVLGQLGTVSTSLTPVEQQALGQLTSLGQQGNQFAPAIGTVANTLLYGGGANNQAGLISNPELMSAGCLPRAQSVYAQLKREQSSRLG
jgi:hypothetical protein